MLVSIEVIAAISAAFAALALIKSVVAAFTRTARAEMLLLVTSNICFLASAGTLFVNEALGFVLSATAVIGFTYFGIVFGFFAVAGALGASRLLWPFVALGVVATAAQGALASATQTVAPLLLSSSIVTGLAALAMAGLIARASRGVGPILVLFLVLSFGIIAAAYLTRLGFLIFAPGSNGVEITTALIAVSIAVASLKWVFAVVALHGRDLTQALARERSRADAANEAKSAFLRAMSHELRTPLNAVIGLTEVMRAEARGPMPEAYRENVRQINASGRHPLTLINDLIDLSAIEAGQLPISPEPVKVEELFDSVEGMMSDQAATARARILHEAPARDLDVMADRRRMLQTLINLVGNALKYGGEGVTIRLSSTLLPDGRLLIAVKDTGPGMPADDIETAFKPYARLGTDRTGRVQGTGLGLPLSRELIELQGGTLSLESSPGAGTTVSICFPASLVHAGAGRTAGSESARARATLDAAKLDAAE